MRRLFGMGGDNSGATTQSPPKTVAPDQRGLGVNIAPSVSGETLSAEQASKPELTPLTPDCLAPFEGKTVGQLKKDAAAATAGGGSSTTGGTLSYEDSLCPVEPLNLLVIQSDDYDWHDLMKNRRLVDGRSIRVVQTSWREIMVGPCSTRTGTAGMKHVPTTSRLLNSIATAQRSEKEERKQQAYSAGDGGLCQLPDMRVEVTVQVNKEWINGKEVRSKQPAAGGGGGDKNKGMGGDEPNRPIRFTPDFVLIREEVTAPNVKSAKNELLGLMYANVPSVNNLQSIFKFTEKPVVQAALNQVQMQLFRGREDAFPLIPQDFFPSSRAFFYGQKFPAVLKFGTAHAGFGKVKVAHHHDMDDFRTLLPMVTEGYCTAEPFVETTGGDYRIQKIGKHLRCYKRTDYSGAWKTNTGTAAVLQEVPVSPRFAEWAAAASRMFCLQSNGVHDEDNVLDILTVDAIIENPKDTPMVVPPDFQTPGERAKTEEVQQQALKEGRFLSDEEKIYILEVNGTSSGLGQEPYCTADNLLMAELIVEKMNRFYCR